MTALDLSAFAVLAIVTTVNLLLLFAVIRRLRVLEGDMREPSALPVPGTLVAGFHVTDTAGGPADEADLAGGPHLVAFVMSSCDPCHAVLAALRDDTRFDPARTLIFVAGEVGDAATRHVLDLADSLGRAAIIEHGGPVTAAFGGVNAFPTLLAIRDGRVVSSGRSLDNVAQSGLLSPAG